jgi:PKD repeat protein
VFSYNLTSDRLATVADADSARVSSGFAVSAGHAVFPSLSENQNALVSQDLRTSSRRDIVVDHPADTSQNSFTHLWRSGGGRIGLHAGAPACFVDCVTFGSAYLLDPASGGTTRAGLGENETFSHPISGGDDRVYDGKCIEQVGVSSRWVLWGEISRGSYCYGYSPHGIHAAFARDRVTGQLKHVASSFHDVFPGERHEVEQLFIEGDLAVMLVKRQADGRRHFLTVNLSTGVRRAEALDSTPYFIYEVDGSRVLYRPEASGEPWLWDMDTGATRRLLDVANDGSLTQHGNFTLSGDRLLFQAYDRPDFSQVTQILDIRTGERKQLFPTPSPPDRPVESYAALGDSVAAGEGIGYGWTWSREHTPDRWVRPTAGAGEWNTDHGVPKDCHQRAEAHPRQVGPLVGVRLLHLACTGAGADNGLDGDRVENGETITGPQLGARYVQHRPELVSLSLGANDVDFVAELKRCYARFDKGSCDTQQARRDLQEKLVVQRAGLRRVLRRIRELGQDAKAPPLVGVTLYADPFPPRHPGVIDQCVDLKPGTVVGASLSSGEMSYLREGLRDLNNGIRDVLLEPEFSGFAIPVDPPSEFGDHRFCSDDPWTFGPFTAVHDQDNQAPFHPTAAGQAEIAKSVANAFGRAQQVPKGTGISVGLPGGVRLRFDQVSVPGTSTAAPLAEASAPVEVGFRRHGRILDIATSARWSGAAQVSIPSSEPRTLYHYTGGRWQEIPSRYENGLVSGEVTSLSPFALGTPVPVATAAFSHSGETVSPADVSFDAADSVVESGSIASYEWDFDDGATATGTTPTHTFRTAGSYEVKLKVTSDQGAVDEMSRTVEIINPPPIAELEAPTSAQPGETVRFDSVGSADENGAVTERIWDFGHGGDPVEGAEVEHAFEEPGDYKVTLTVLDNEGEPASKSTTITVADTIAPQTTIGSGPKDFVRSDEASFSFSSSEAGSSFECRLDSGSWEPCSPPKALSDLPDGDHTFSVRAKDPAGNQDQSEATRRFTVDTQAPQTTLTSTPGASTTDTTPTFAFTASETGSGFACRMDAASFAPCSSPFTSPALSAGSHRFEVRASDRAGNADPTVAAHSFAVRAAVVPPSSPAPGSQPLATGGALDRTPPQVNSLRVKGRTRRRARRRRGVLVFSAPLRPTFSVRASDDQAAGARVHFALGKIDRRRRCAWWSASRRDFLKASRKQCSRPRFFEGARRGAQWVYTPGKVFRLSNSAARFFVVARAQDKAGNRSAHKRVAFRFARR